MNNEKREVLNDKEMKKVSGGAVVDISINKVEEVINNDKTVSVGSSNNMVSFGVEGEEETTNPFAIKINNAIYNLKTKGELTTKKLD